jgi:two-component system CheB/CheR fusion protein
MKRKKNPHVSVETAPLGDSLDQSNHPDNFLDIDDGSLDNAPNQDVVFPIVAIGASAGGLRALEAFFHYLPGDTGAAFVVIQHLSPKHKSIMGELLGRRTPMPVRELEDNLQLEPNCVYVNPPHKEVALLHGVIQLLDRPDTTELRLPIDSFFRSLAEDRGEKAICIVLSGTGSDGTLGLQSIKAAGGMTMVQVEKQAEYGSMPKSAIDTGLVDFILPVEEMPKEIMGYLKHPYLSKDRLTLPADSQFQSMVSKILLAIRSTVGHDFSHYKPNTIHRRIGRRMAVHRIDNISEYYRYMKENPTEVQTLFKDMLITVTAFFRDPAAFAVLEDLVLPRILENRGEGGIVRVWAPGCATGEEALSMAMLFVEAQEKLGKFVNLQIFATDIDTAAIERARLAEYPESIAADLTPERLARFFLRIEGGFKAKKEIRDLIVFAPQNLVSDPPFSKLDLISCRNLLIYMNAPLQKKIFSVFHYVLNPQGYLFLGSSETVGSFAGLFTAIDLKYKIYQRKEAGRADLMDFPPLLVTNNLYAGLADPTRIFPKKPDFLELTSRIIFKDYAPPCVIINERYDVLFSQGATEKYLSLPEGEVSFNILKMVRPGLRGRLGPLIHKALQLQQPVTAFETRLRQDDTWCTLDMTVHPLREKSANQNLLMIIFEEKSIDKKLISKKKMAATTATVQHVQELEQELQSSKEYLQTTIEELETANEELKSTNEELQSTNEELQSTNEELETAKEELQSTNEELITVNSELQDKVEELTKANNDINNLLASTEIGTIFLDTQLCIKRFTPSMTRLVNLIPSDINRPISDITVKFAYENLYNDAAMVLSTLQAKEVEVEAGEGRWFSIRLLPYRTRDNMIDGVVITFVDITDLVKGRRTQAALRRTLEYFEAIVDTLPQPLLVLQGDLTVRTASPAFYQTFQVSPEETEKRRLYELGNGPWNMPGLRERLEQIIPQDSVLEGFLVEADFPIIGRKQMRLNARKIKSPADHPALILLVMEEVGRNR